MIAATDPHDDAPVGDDVRHRVVLGKADRVPHRQNIEGATELEPLGLRGEPQSELDQVGQALVTLALEVMLGRPQHVIAESVHQLCDVAGRGEDLPQPFGGVASFISGRAGPADVVELDLSDIEHVEVSDHRSNPAI